MWNRNQEKPVTSLVGHFADADVHVGDLITKSIDSENFAKPEHDVTYKGQTYRFINPDSLSDESLETLKQDKDAYVFDGDLNGLHINVTSGGIRSQHIPELG
ncbi:MAG: hypothetical protein ACRBCK_01365 [Alphaproteobacteria bacterium]